MSTATVTSKGQVTIPLAVRQALGLQAGSQLDFLLEPGGIRV
ncbi:MAG: AbrB/MazE/SpoVT family DNA-binding domain-containing protein, partial [Burkholderiales bacterium]|nr:AbrB/MazE/SpoVT family DNA-binding domain-containing protein [Burkholderiales bacterium]